MDARLALYEPWMAPQVAELFHRQWGVSRDDFSDRFARFYEHSYQRERSLRVVALDGDRVAGITGFAYWPYLLDGRRFHVLQCCDALVAEGDRRRGVFRRMLEFASGRRAHLKFDFLLAFPVAASKHGFVRDGWQHVLDLQWYVKLLNPLAFLSGDETKKLSSAFSDSRPAAGASVPGRFRLSDEPEFREWRRHYAHRERYYVHRFGRSGAFELKAIRRHGLLRELIVGDVPSGIVPEAIARLVSGARKGGITYLSIAANPRDPSIAAFMKAGFRQVNRRIPFVVKPFDCTELATDPSRWSLFRSDIDTW